MKVKELIKELEMYDPKMEVYRTEGDGVNPVKKIDTYGLETKLVLEIQ